MKKGIKIFATMAIVTTFLFSCSKTEGVKNTEVREVALMAQLSIGQTYNLDLSSYGVQHATAIIEQQAVNATGSILTVKSANPFSASYQYTAMCSNSAVAATSASRTATPCQPHNDQVVLLVQEDDGTKGSAHNNGSKESRGDKGNCKDRDEKTPHPAATRITINFEIQ